MYSVSIIKPGVRVNLVQGKSPLVEFVVKDQTIWSTHDVSDIKMILDLKKGESGPLAMSSINVECYRATRGENSYLLKSDGGMELGKFYVAYETRALLSSLINDDSLGWR